jgi:UDP-GlcNAc:undecaprenyl-phosphate/decaprenyl-phosphate GlcNAc-1-phosphate transferase
MKLWLMIVWCAAAFGAGLLVFRVLARTLQRGGHVRMNFMGREIPTSLGVGFVMLAFLMLLASALVFGNITNYAGPLAIVVCGFGLLGLLDDVIQVRESGGFRGHLERAGSEGVISTALLKAFFGLMLSLTAAALFWRAEGVLMVVIDTLIVTLSANAINLLDVRPGRAIKGFLAATLFILIGSTIGRFIDGGIAGISPITWYLIGPFLLWAVAFAAIDFTCRGMMGDAGSNTLGAVLGILIVWELSVQNRAISLGLLIGFHLFSEAISISALIERTPALKWLDSIGIRPAAEPLE